MSISHNAASTTRRPRSQRSARQPQIDAAGFGVWHWSTTSSEVTLSPCAAAIHGIEPDAFAGTLDAFGDLIHPEDRDRTIAALFSAFAANADRFVEYRTSASEGASPWVFTWVGSASGDDQTPAGLTGVCLGSDTSHHPDHLLQRARSQFGVILDGITDGITVQTPAGDHIYANAAAHHIFGIDSVAELQALSHRQRRERFASTDQAGRRIPSHQFPMTRALRGEEPAEMLLQLQPLDGGDRRWVTIKSTPITDDQGSVRFVVNRLRDMTGERRRQEEMSESKARYRQLFEGNPVPMWVFDTHTLRFLAVNDAAIHEYGWSRPEFLSLSLLDIRPPEDRPAILDKLAHITATPGGLDVAGVWRHRRRDGTPLDAEVTTHAINFDGREARVSLAINVTERTRHERRLERLSALTAALSAALVPREVAKVVSQYATSAGADVAAVAAFSAADQTVTVLHRTGYPAQIPEQSNPFPVANPTMLGLVIRTGQPIIAPTWDEFDQLHPELADSREFAGENGGGAGLILPLADDRPIGALKMGFRQPRPFAPALLDELRTIANLCAQALERAQLYAAEQQARAQAEIGERVARREAARIAIMADLARTLAEARLDYHSVLDAVARTAAEHTGDACAIAIFGDHDGEYAIDAVYHVDPTIRTDVRAHIDAAWQPAISAAVAGIAASDEAMLTPVVNDQRSDRPEMAGGGAPPPPVTLRSLLVLPLRAHGRITGALILMRLRPDQPYSDDDLVFFQELSDRAALALDNARLYQEAQVAVRARDEFLSAAAHELRTPVTTVKGYAQMLLRAQARGDLAADRVPRFLQAIDESTDRLRVLTDDLLDVSRLRLGQMPLHPRSVDLMALTTRLIERYETQFDDRHALTLVSDAPAAVVSADPGRIEQVLSNLIENAAKYSPDGGPISITIASVDRGIQLSISDIGIGLPTEALESIFEPFSRAENAIRDNVPGLGLGLYICASIVRRHDGRIEAESAGEGRGTTFHLWLPTEGPTPKSDPALP